MTKLFNRTINAMAKKAYIPEAEPGQYAGFLDYLMGEGVEGMSPAILEYGSSEYKKLTSERTFNDAKAAGLITPALQKAWDSYGAEED